MTTWLLIANGSRARVLEETDAPGPYAHVADLVHPETRIKGSELDTDRPGHAVRPGHHGLGSTAYAPRTDAHDHERLRFAREVAAVLDEGVRSGRCTALKLVASNPFLGELKSALDAACLKVVLHSLPVDYTSFDEAELARRLR